MTPFVGMIVLYKDSPNAPGVPAIVTRVHSATEVNLRVFFDNGVGAGSFFGSALFNDTPTAPLGSWRYGQLPEGADVPVKATPMVQGTQQSPPLQPAPLQKI